ncbi:MAG: NAD(P)H-hydrate dehydratase [Bacteroidetes bacterium]|nr:NAD(P)H-hydrate dehydratase [Bacteroidota bacterium]
MKIFSTEQIRNADQFTIENEPVSSLNLTERAGAACAKWILNRFDTATEFKIICGTGNNGGDGFVIARLLMEGSYKVQTFIINQTDKRSTDFTANYKRFTIENSVIEIDSINAFQKGFKSNRDSVVIDAILGSGLNRPITGLYGECIKLINQLSIPVIAIDIPSGLYCDTLNSKDDIIVKATYTLSLQFPKLSCMFTENAQYIGEFSILDIGLHPDYIAQTFAQDHFITKNDVQLFLKIRNKISHKGNYGHALLIAGSYGKIGAAVLSAKACMQSGVGLLTVHVPKCGYEIMQTSIPEVMVDADTETNFISDNIRIEKYNTIGIGPGIGTEKQTQNIVKLLIQNSDAPLVFDADAINILAENKTWLSFIPAGCIFTPHPKEFERLVGRSENSMERLQLQKDFSFKYKAYVVLKGAHTAISCPDGNVFFNSTGNPGMATAGSGDVLTGIITSLLAQGYTSRQACILGVYLHGLAGDLAADKKTEESMIASDIIENLGEAFKYLRDESPCVGHFE